MQPHLHDSLHHIHHSLQLRSDQRILHRRRAGWSPKELMLSRRWNHSRWATQRSRWGPALESALELGWEREQELELDWDSEPVSAWATELASAKDWDSEPVSAWETEMETASVLASALELGSRKRRSKQNQTSLQFRCCSMLARLPGGFRQQWQGSCASRKLSRFDTSAYCQR